MIIKKHIKEIEKLLNHKTIIEYDILQISFGIACLKLKISNNKKYIAKFFISKKNKFNAIKSETKNLLYLNKKFNFFPKIIKYNDNYLIIEYLENDKKIPKVTKPDLLNSIIELHSFSNKLYGFDFDTQMGALKQVNDYDNSWVSFYSNNRLNSIFEIANQKESMGKFINDKILLILKNMKNLIPNKPPAVLLHGDMWEGNILFKKNDFIGFIDPGSFFGHNEMEVAYLRWFNPSFIDSKFIEKYDYYITINKNYLSYEPIYQLYYALCNVALWNRSYIKETAELLKKLKV